MKITNSSNSNSWTIYTKGKQGDKRLDKQSRKAAKQIRYQRRNGKRFNWESVA